LLHLSAAVFSALKFSLTNFLQNSDFRLLTAIATSVTVASDHNELV